jgi:manganese efflux pump family protein
MTKVALLALALGLDSFRVSAALGMGARDRNRDWQLASAFALSDAFALLLGLALGSTLSALVGEWARITTSLLLGGYALYVIRASASSEELDTAGKWIRVGLPLTLSLDNLMAGAALGSERLPALLCALTVGAASGALSLLGLKVGDSISALLRGRGRVAGGALLLFAAVSVGLSLP